jgi:hypothetical protein
MLNEGNMGSNKCTLDFFDYTKGTYYRNIYAEINPNVVKELGDVGNDIKIYGSKLYIVVNVSNKIEVLDARRLNDYFYTITELQIFNLQRRKSLCKQLCRTGRY